MVATEDMCVFCFDALRSELETRSEHPLNYIAPDGVSNDLQCPMFVTWEKEVSMGSYELRGCIGTLSAVPIGKLGYYALSSAIKDRRFPPIQFDEVPLLKVSVSLLTNYEPASSITDWEVGKHGIMIDFIVGSESYSGTYLPDVASEQGWNHQRTIDSLVRKTGYRGTITSALLSSMKITRYQSSKCRLEYKEYLTLKQKGAK